MGPTRLPTARTALISVLVPLLLGLLAGPAAAATLITVPADGRYPNAGPAIVPHQAYNGHRTTLKAIVRGLPDLTTANASTFAWDTDADGDFSDETEEALRQCVSGTPEGVNCYDLSKQITLPTQVSDQLFSIQVRLTVPAQAPVVATYPVRVDASVPAQTDPADNGTAPAQNASPAQLAVMRAVAIDDALWWMHLQMTNRTGTQSRIAGQLPSNAYSDPSGAFLRTAAHNHHRPAYPPGTYVHGGSGSPPPGFAAANDARYAGDPYAETAVRAMNGLLLTASVFATTAADEADDDTTPIPGTNNLIAIGNGCASCGSNIMPTGDMTAGLAASGLAGTTAQVGNPTHVLGRPMERIVQDLVDHAVWAQNDGGAVGSWYYTPNANLAFFHESIFRGPLVGLTASREMARDGVYVNELVRGRLATFLPTNTTAQAT